NAHPYLARIQQRPGYQRGNAANVPPAPGEPVKRPA
ncbi:MAG: glutathione S-transferase family protein, partial [Bradyrhizobium sp.]|nr:glutathione S-transferase family protein [Bradyrhizobium sp.]